MIDDTVLDKMWGKATVWVHKLYSSKHKGIDMVILRGVGPVRLSAFSPKAITNGGQRKVRFYILP